MLKYGLLSLSAFALSVNSFSQFWAQRAGGITIDEASDISVDAAGNSYTTGYFTTTAGFGTQNLVSVGTSDVFLTKTSATGIFQWSVKGGGVGSDRGLSVKADASGNSYITGYFFGTATFGTTPVTSAGNQDIFIAKYNTSGVLQWVTRAGGSGSDIGSGITVDPSGNVIITGEFSGTANFGTASLTSQSGVDVFTAKLDGSGNFLWAERGAGTFTDRGFDVDCDASGNIFVTGQFSDTITFDVPHYTNMQNAIFTVKYNPSGVEQAFAMAGAGTSNISSGIVVDGNNNVLITGDFTGTLTFFGTPNTTLTNLYPKRIFVAKYNNSLSLQWTQADGSSSDISSQNIAVDANNNPFIVGNFKCRLNEYADQYGQGIFNTVGFWDIFVTKYNSSGVWQWSRQVGGKQENYGTGIDVNSAGQAIICGSFDLDLCIATTPNFLGYNFMSIPQNTANFGPYCNDPNYSMFDKFTTNGNYDIFIGNCFDPTREPYDYYKRSGTGCSRPYDSVCINSNPVNNLVDNTCDPDSIDVCLQTYLFAASNTSAYNPNVNSSFGPDFTYLWSTGATTNSIQVTASGTYWVQLTSADGCFVSTDTIYVDVHPGPAPPTITDDHGFNNNAVITVPVNMCEPDSALLTGGNYSPNTYTWSGPNGTTTSTTMWATVPGTYCFTVTDVFGCTKETCVNVVIDSLLPPIDPAMYCVQDTDRNDSISLCDNLPFTMYVYDTITNPNGVLDCIPYSTMYWTATPANWITYSNVTNCSPFTWNTTFDPDSTGWYTLTCMWVRTNVCDTDTVIVTRNLYVEIYPVPSATLSITLTGNNMLCPGDSTLLVATGATTYQWNGPNGILPTNNDSVYVSQPGLYFIFASTTVTNQYGCTATASAFATINVQVKPQPVATMNPANGIICPGDSVQLSTTGGPGNYQWIGPSGPVGGNNNPIYVNQPGQYYCIVTDNQNCTLVSNTLTLTQYATPFLQASPAPILCPGDTVWISATSSDSGAVQWQPPLTGTALMQMVTQPGTYSTIITSCGIPTLVSITVTMTNVSAVISPSALTECAGDSIILTADTTGLLNYVWQPGNISTVTYTATASGIYTLNVTDPGGCSATDSIAVTFVPNNTPLATVIDTSVCPSDAATLFASGTGTLYWYSDSLGQNLIHTGTSYTTGNLSSPVTYYVQNSDSLCRSGLVPVNVTFENCDTLYVPNVITPNGDGINDVFFVVLKNPDCFHAEIFNRWGNLIYEWDDYTQGWPGVNNSGEIVSDGVYYYIVDYCKYNGDPGVLTGFVQVLLNAK